MAPNRKSSGGGSASKQQRSISSFFSATSHSTKKPLPIISSPENGSPQENKMAHSPISKMPIVHADDDSTFEEMKQQENKPIIIPHSENVEKRKRAVPPSPPEAKVGKRLKVYWPMEDAMFPGVVASYDDVSGKHKVVYDDGDEEEMVLAEEKVEWLSDEVNSRKTRKSLRLIGLEEDAKETMTKRKRLRKLSTVSTEDGVVSEDHTEIDEVVKHKRSKKRYVASSSDESEDDKQVHENNQEKRLDKNKTLTKEHGKSSAITESVQEDDKKAKKVARFRKETLEVNESTSATKVVQTYECDPSLVLSGEALERFGDRILKKFSFLGKNRLDASGRRPSSPNYDPRTLFLPAEFLKGLTGGQKQWWEFKAKHMDKVMLFKMGKFYEMFEMDAHIGARDLDLQYMKGEQPHCGFPEKNYFENVDKLVRKGHRVLVVEQTETPEQLEERKRKTGVKDKVVRREICAVITRGTVVDSDMISDNAEPAFLLTITEKQNEDGNSVIGLCVADASRALFMLGQVLDDSARTKLKSVLAELRPVELVKSRGLTEATERALREQTRKPLVSEIEFWDFNKTEKEINTIYKKQNYVLQKLVELKTTAEPVLLAFGGCISYLKQVLLDRQLLDLGRIELLPSSDILFEYSDSRSSVSSESYMVLDSAALENLEILENNCNGGLSGTLIGLLDHCVTPFGRRLLKQWIVRPLFDIDAILQRQRAVQDMQGVAESAVSEFRRELGGIPDLERLLARLNANSGESGRNAQKVVLYEDAARKQIKELTAALRGCHKMIKAVSCFKQFLTKLKSSRLKFLLSVGEGFPDVEPLVKYFEDAFDWSEAEKTGRISLEDDSLTASNPRDKLERYLKSQRKLFNNSEISYVTVGKDSYLLEIPEELHTKVPSDFEPRSSRKGYRRYWTPRVKELLQELALFENEKEVAIKGVLIKLMKRFCESHDIWLSAVRAVSEVDALMSISCVRLHMEGATCFPTLLRDLTKPSFTAKVLRHPIMSLAGNAFVPNDTFLGGSQYPHFILLTGPNMGGKSTLLRQVCLAMILAQIGAEVPAESLELTPADRLFVRMGAKDHIMSGQSTFLVELLETSVMLRCATRNSFVALDELGRGTATSDGQAIAYAVLRYLSHTVQCRGMFSSHYHELANEHASDPAVALHHMACKVASGDNELETVTFLYKLTSGPCPKSYGVNVARLAGMPESVLHRAVMQSSKLEQQEKFKEKDIEILRNILKSPSFDQLISIWKTLREENYAKIK